jgi:hypothetical protein
MTPSEFEHAIAALCRQDGYHSVQVVGGAGDLGADVIGVSPEGARLVIQAKHYREDRLVSSPEMQRFGGTCFLIHRANRAVMVTTSDFTQSAQDYASRAGIDLVNGRALEAWAGRSARNKQRAHPAYVGIAEGIERVKQELVAVLGKAPSPGDLDSYIKELNQTQNMLTDLGHANQFNLRALEHEVRRVLRYLAELRDGRTTTAVVVQRLSV